MNFNAVYYEPDSLNYTLGRELKQKYDSLPWTPIESHNKIVEMTSKPNTEFAKMKKNLIIGVRKTHKYVENQKVSDFLVPYTSSGCSASCLYCYLVCNYNKCSYLRLFVNREQMLDKIIKTATKSERPLTFEIGSNSDLVLENTITGNLKWTIENFNKTSNGFLTFPTKFDMVGPLLNLEHGGRVIFRMSVNPEFIIRKTEFGTSSLDARIKAVNNMCEAGYKTGILIAPVVQINGWEKLYGELISYLADRLSEKVKKQLFIECIFMTYSYVHRAINAEAFPNAIELYDKEKMTGGGRGKYYYRQQLKAYGEDFLRQELSQKLSEAEILYFC
ncbi:MAG: Spore photoproduct lyase [Firmicutes bacterium ADurb.Bin193]|nr:MAG: Spore photoproduct lyase [Firmicutes bacterium ADurb.Bin193]